MHVAEGCYPARKERIYIANDQLIRNDCDGEETHDSHGGITHVARLRAILLLVILPFQILISISEMVTLKAITLDNLKGENLESVIALTYLYQHWHRKGDNLMLR